MASFVEKNELRELLKAGFLGAWARFEKLITNIALGRHGRRRQNGQGEHLPSKDETRPTNRPARQAD